MSLGFHPRSAMATSSVQLADGGAQIDEEMPENLRIPPSDITIGDEIGRGGFSTVHQACWRGQQCAAKVFRTANVLAIQKEVAILSKLSHPHIMGCIGFSVDTAGDPSRCLILMELMESDLRHLMDERLKGWCKPASPFKQTEAVDILYQIASGMEYLHRQRVFHGDLKASNVLVSHGLDGKLLVKITDFGVSQMVKLDPAETSEEFIGEKYFRGVVGTRGYQAPEVSSSQGYTYQYRAPEAFIAAYEEGKLDFYTARADVYCFAMTSYEVFSGRVPFEFVQNWKIPSLVQQGVRPKLPRRLHPRLANLTTKCWDNKPIRRPGFTLIKKRLENWSRDESSKGSVSSLDQSRTNASKCWGGPWGRFWRH